MTILGTLSSIGMACGPPLIYADQARTIWQKRDSSGFSHDVCGIILVANITRCFFYIGHPFELTLLYQSILLILSQLALLSLCLHFRPAETTSNPEGIRSFWRWRSLGSYLEFLAGLILVLLVLQFIVGRWAWYYESLGYIALGIESTLPIPQFISNWQRKSCAGLSDLTVLFWLLGDLFKTAYFFVRGNPWQFRITAIVTVLWDIGIAVQRFTYGKPPINPLDDEDAEPMVPRHTDDNV
ncbi:hypothetical protein NliqN6_4815 [Naganishia liquefaciens]|uniref:PQ-loop repeat-containing protein n=1 Tax=Naganishia liquefaciens TaxID=104408 RepID=A0A8H3TX25_9TREE|nr:hypothetical protein NliqN6_4815 [Naganishia liquefaciens]